MVPSYCPSECHADYFDFERIAALKPAIEACGISTLSQSPMLGFHKQMDNRRSEERFSRNAETDLVCRLLLEKKKANFFLLETLGTHATLFVASFANFLSSRVARSTMMALLLSSLGWLHFVWLVAVWTTLTMLFVFFLSLVGGHRYLHSFPTRRSSDLLNLLLRLVAFLLFLNPQCLASISRWITASSSWKRFCLFVCRAWSSIMVICMLTAIRLLLTFVMSLYLLLRS